MRKQHEIADPESCLNKSQNNEMIFVLRGHDVAAPFAIRQWVQMRVTMGKNKLEDEQMQSALSMAGIMERER